MFVAFDFATIEAKAKRDLRGSRGEASGQTRP